MPIMIPGCAGHSWEQETHLILLRCKLLQNKDSTASNIDSYLTRVT